MLRIKKESIPKNYNGRLYNFLIGEDWSVLNNESEFITFNKNSLTMVTISALKDWLIYNHISYE